jgi:hypothetical protein
MRIAGFSALCLAVVFASGCSTSQHVRSTRMSPHARIETVAQAPQDGNSPEMNGYLVDALRDEGLSVRAPLHSGTRTAPDVDAIVSYVDVWRWDVKMYMKSLSVQIYDARTGDLLVTGEWSDSTMHGFRNPKDAMRGVVAEMMTKLRHGDGARY